MSDLHLESAFVSCEVKGRRGTWGNQQGGHHCLGKGMAQLHHLDNEYSAPWGTDGYVEAQAEQMSLGPQPTP